MVFTNITPFPTVMTPITNISPLTYRDAGTFLEYLETIRQWLNETMVPDTNNTINGMFEEFQTAIQNSEATTNQAKAGWQAAFDEFMANVVAELEALNDTAVTNLLESSSSEVSGWVNENLARVATVGRAFGNGVIDTTQHIRDRVEFANVFGLDVFIPDGNYVVTGTITVPSGMKIYGSPDAVINIAGIPDGVPAFTAAGTWAPAVALAADLVEGGSTMTPLDTAGLSPGDYLKISSNQSFGSTLQPRGEIVRIRSIANGMVTFEDPLMDSYPVASDGKYEKAAFVENVVIEGITIVGPTVARNIIGLSFNACRNIAINNVRTKNLHNTGIQFIDVIESSISDCHITDLKLAGFAVGIAILWASQDIVITNCTGARMRHLVATGGGTSRRGINRRIAVSNCTANQMDDSGFDAHPASEYVSFKGCHVNGSGQDGFTMQSGRFIIEGCTVNGATRHGILVQTLTTRGSDGVIANNRVTRCTSRGIVVTIDPTTEYQVWSGITIIGNVVTSTTGIAVENASSTFTVPGIVVANNIVRRSSSHGIWLRGLSGPVVNGNHVSGISVNTVEGIYLQTCPESVVSGNMIDGGGFANRCLRLFAAPDSTLTGNLFKGASGQGITSDATSNNVVYMGNRNLCIVKGSLLGSGHVQSTADNTGSYNL